MAGSETQRTISARALTKIEEFEKAVELQKKVWGFADIETLPRRLFVVIKKVGGQVFGAYSGAEMIGFLIALPGIKADGEAYLHSDMLGVETPFRNRGVGRMLKLMQREDALARGIRLVEWTFDPLELKNAYFNIERLGATVQRYHFNHYGITTSALHGGIPTDRCVAEWYVASDHVKRITAGETSPRPETIRRINVPQAVDQWRTEDPERVRKIQKEIGERFAEYFDQKLSVTGFERTGDTGTYLFGKWDIR